MILYRVVGESILVCQEQEKAQATKLMKTELPAAKSCLVKNNIRGENFDGSYNKEMFACPRKDG